MEILTGIKNMLNKIGTIWDEKQLYFWAWVASLILTCYTFDMDVTRKYPETNLWFLILWVYSLLVFEFMVYFYYKKIHQVKK